MYENSGPIIDFASEGIEYYYCKFILNKEVCMYIREQDSSRTNIKSKRKEDLKLP